MNGYICLAAEHVIIEIIVAVIAITSLCAAIVIIITVHI